MYHAINIQQNGHTHEITRLIRRLLCCGIVPCTTGSPSALCVGSGFRGHLIEFGRSILELIGYYLMPNKCKNLKDMKSSCLSVCTNSL